MSIRIFENFKSKGNAGEDAGVVEKPEAGQIRFVLKYLTFTKLKKFGKRYHSCPLIHLLNPLQ